MNKPKPGELIRDPAMLGRKDAFHVAAIAVRASSSLSPGDSVRFESASLVRICALSERQAIVDPFIDAYIPQGQVFWALPLPELVGNLTHTFEVEGLRKSVADISDDPDDDPDDWCRMENC